MQREIVEALWLIRQGFPLREIASLVDLPTMKLKRLLKYFKPRDLSLRSSNEPVQLLCDLSPIPDLNLYPLRGDEDDRPTQNL